MSMLYEGFRLYKVLIVNGDRNCLVWFGNALCHRAKPVQEYLCQEDIKVLEWPLYSPDLHCIENVWAVLKMKVRNRNPCTVDELEDLVHFKQSFIKLCAKKLKRNINAFTKYRKNGK